MGVTIKCNILLTVIFLKIMVTDTGQVSVIGKCF